MPFIMKEKASSGCCHHPQKKRSTYLLLFILAFVVTFLIQVIFGLIAINSVSKEIEKENKLIKAIPDNTNKVTKWLDLITISNRENDTLPLKGFVNSLLLHTTNAIRLNIVTAKRILWLEELNTTKYFSIHFHDPDFLEAHVKNWSHLSYKSFHYSKEHAFQKIFIQKLNFPPGTSSKMLLADDDILYYEDITPLIDLVQTNKDRWTFVCPVDARRAKLYHGRYPKIGSSGHYCSAGMIGFPLKKEYTDVLIHTLQDIIGLYKHRESPLGADQDVANKLFVDDEKGNTNTTDLIPCQWHCDWNSCGAGKKSISPPDCETCPGITRCNAFHFGAGGYRREHNYGQQSYPEYYKLNTKELLHSTFIPRVKNSSNVELVA